MAAASTDLLQEVGIASATTLDSPGYTIGDTSITVVSVSTWPTATGITFAMDQVDAAGVQVAGTYNEYVGIKSSATSITSVSHQNGTNQNYTAGATTRVYIPVSAERENRIVEWGLQDHTQLGYHETLTDTNGNEWIKQTATTSAVNEVTVANAATSNGPTISATGDDTNIDLVIKPKGTGKIKPGFLDGWSYNTLPSVSSVTNNGNRSYDVTFASTVASYLTPGMRVRTSRTVAAPTYMGGALNGSSHYFTKATPSGTLGTVTNNFTLMGWVEPTAYQVGVIMGRSDSTPANGWVMRLTAAGQVELICYNAGAANYRIITTYQSLPLNKKTHIAASWTGGTVVFYFDGVSVPVSAAVTSGTAPTTGATGGDFSVGRHGAFNGQYFAGYVSGVGVFDAVLTASTIKSYSSQVLSGSETNCIGAWSLNNTANDQNAAANNLTATGGVSYTSGKAPYATDATGTATGTYDYGIVTKVATTVATVQVPEGCAIPTSGGVSAVDLSSVKSPFGFPAQVGRWRVEMIARVLTTQNAPVASTWYNINSQQLTIPVGDWSAGYMTPIYVDRAAAGTVNIRCTLSNANNTELDRNFTTFIEGANTTIIGHGARLERPLSVTAQTVYYQNISTSQASMSNLYMLGDRDACTVYVIPAHL